MFGDWVIDDWWFMIDDWLDLDFAIFTWAPRWYWCSFLVQIFIARMGQGEYINVPSCCLVHVLYRDHSSFDSYDCCRWRVRYFVCMRRSVTVLSTTGPRRTCLFNVLYTYHWLMLMYAHVNLWFPVLVSYISWCLVPMHCRHHSSLDSYKLRVSEGCLALLERWQCDLY